MASHSSSKGALAIFAKTIPFTPVKTRLAATEGREFAESFYRASLSAVAATVRQSVLQGIISPFWAIAEADGARYWKDFPFILQGDGGLGQRLAHVFEQLSSQFPAVVVIGSDTPQVKQQDLAVTCKWLLEKSEARSVVGPSRDGGFHLFGSNVAPARTDLCSIVYSTPTTRAQLIEHVARNTALHELPELTDLDTVADIPFVVNELQNTKERTPEQQFVLDLLTTKIGRGVY